MSLHIVDLSSVLHTGKVINKYYEMEPRLNKETGRYYSPGYPIGSLSYLFNILLEVEKDDDLVFVADRYPAIKVAMSANYKAGRQHEKDINFSKEAAEIILKDMAYTVLYKEDYEADDIAYTLCKKYYNEYDRIYLHTDDSDMFVVVNDKVSCVNIRKGGKFVTKDNFSYTVRKNENVPYNTLTMDKIINGDSSDNIAPIPKEKRAIVYKIYRALDFSLWGNKESVRSIAVNMFPWLVPQIDLVFPLDVDIELPSSSIIREIDVNRRNQWAVLLKNMKYSTNIKITEDVRNKADSLLELYDKTGTY